jgi:hypothetical protein
MRKKGELRLFEIGGKGRRFCERRHIMPTPAQNISGRSTSSGMERTFSVLSQLPVQSAMPSVLTPRQLTLFSCPVSTPTRSPFRVSQTLQVQSSYPPNRMRPEMEKATEVIPQRMLSCVKVFNSRSARMSNSRQEASSEPVAKASPLGKNLVKTDHYKGFIRESRIEYALHSIDIGFVTSESLCCTTAADIP